MLTTGQRTVGRGLAPDGVLLSRVLADQLGARPGDRVRVRAGAGGQSARAGGTGTGARLDLRVAGIAREQGPGGYTLGPVVFAPLGVAQRIVGANLVNVVWISAPGGIRDSLAAARRAVPAVRQAVAALGSRVPLQVQEAKAGEISSARSGSLRRARGRPSRQRLRGLLRAGRLLGVFLRAQGIDPGDGVRGRRDPDPGGYLRYLSPDCPDDHRRGYPRSTRAASRAKQVVLVTAALAGWLRGHRLRGSGPALPAPARGRDPADPGGRGPAAPPAGGPGACHAYRAGARRMVARHDRHVRTGPRPDRVHRRARGGRGHVGVRADDLDRRQPGHRADRRRPAGQCIRRAAGHLAPAAGVPVPASCPHWPEHRDVRGGRRDAHPVRGVLRDQPAGLPVVRKRL